MILLVLVGLIVLYGYFFLQTARFGAAPGGKRLDRINRSFHFRDNQFQNLSPTPQLTEGSSMPGVLKEFFFNSVKNKKPPAPLPSEKTDLLHLNRTDNVLVWFGHSSYFMQIDGRRFLVDPVFSGNASPLRFTTKSFPGSDVYSVSDLPAIDDLIITHDHWDHLDYRTVLKLKPVVGRVITSLGVGAHLEYWGFDSDKVDELDWREKKDLGSGFNITAVPARHFSGRGFKRNGTDWNAFILKTPSKNILIGGDSGYDSHFLDIGNEYGPFDLVILENGQYDKNWKYIHMMPEETVQAALDLKAKKLLPVHWAKFSLSVHAWNDPILRIKKEAGKKNLILLHPMIGQAVYFDREQSFSNWWESVQ